MVAERVRLRRLEAWISEVDDGFFALCKQNAVSGVGASPDGAVRDLEVGLRAWCAADVPIVLEVTVLRRLVLDVPESTEGNGA